MEGYESKKQELDSEKVVVVIFFALHAKNEKAAGSDEDKADPFENTQLVYYVQNGMAAHPQAQQPEVCQHNRRTENADEGQVKRE